MASFAPLRSNGGQVVQKIVKETLKRPDFDEIEKIPGPGDELSPIRSSPHSTPGKITNYQNIQPFPIA